MSGKFELLWRVLGRAGASAALVAAIVPGFAQEAAAGPEAADKTLGMAIMGAVVAQDGTALRLAGVKSTSLLSDPAGPYKVEFERDVSDCIVVVGLTSPFTSGFVRVNVDPEPTDPPNVLHITTRDAAGGPAIRPFSLLAFCPK